MENVLITGASGGIGTALCVAFAQTGANIAVHYNKNRKKAENLVSVLRDSYGVNAIAVQADVAVRESVNAMFDEIDSELGGVDILINNAGIAQQKLFSHLSGGIAVYDPASEGQYCKSVLHLGYFRSEL